MGLINFHYVIILFGAAFGMLYGTADYLSRGQYLEAAALFFLPLPAGYLAASITPWVRKDRGRKLLATPLFAIGLFFAFAFAAVYADLV